MTLRARLSTAAFLLLCFVRCNAPAGQPATVPTVHVPARHLPGTSPVPEMDELLQSLRPGGSEQVKIVFADRSTELLTPERFNIRRGSLYLLSSQGYFRMDDQQRVFSSPDGIQEEDMISSHTQDGQRFPAPRLSINGQAISCTNSARHDLDLKFKVQPLEQQDTDQTVLVTIRLSNDFDGDLTGWRSARGK